MSEWLIQLLYFPRHRNSGSPFRRSWIGESLHPSTYLSSFCSNNLLLRKLYSATTLIQTQYHIEWWFPILRDHYRQCWDKIQRSEEHTSELQSRGHFVCRLLLEKKNDKKKS